MRKFWQITCKVLGIKEAKERVKDATLDEWVNRWFDLLLMCLDAHVATAPGDIELQQVRGLRQEIMVLISRE